MLSFPFIGTGELDALGLAADDVRRRAVALRNPLDADRPLMRTTLLPGLLDTVQRNISRGNRDLLVFEIGSVFLPRTQRARAAGSAGRPQTGFRHPCHAERCAAEPAVAPRRGAGGVGRASGLVGSWPSRGLGRRHRTRPPDRRDGRRRAASGGRGPGTMAPGPVRRDQGGGLADRLRGRTRPRRGRATRTAAPDGGDRDRPGRAARSAATRRSGDQPVSAGASGCRAGRRRLDHGGRRHPRAARRWRRAAGIRPAVRRLRRATRSAPAASRWPSRWSSGRRTGR